MREILKCAPIGSAPIVRKDAVICIINEQYFKTLTGELEAEVAPTLRLLIEKVKAL